jgi:hypothetical protein
MKGNAYIRILLPVLVLILLVLVFVFVRNRSPFGKAETRFSSDAGREITALEISSADRKVLLSFRDGIWKVNQDAEARKSITVFIMRVLKEMKIKSPVSSEMFQEQVVEKNIRPVKVKVYEKKRFPRSFYVYRTTSNRYGNIMKVKERSRPFIVHFPGFEGDIGSVFNPDELFWQPYVLFNLLPSEISSLTLDNYADSSSSFRISITEKSFSFSHMSAPLTGWDTTRLKRYISYYTMVPFEGWAFEMKEDEKTLLSNEKPFCRISVTTNDGKNIGLNLWERVSDGEKDAGRLWGKTDGREDYMIVRYFDIDPLLKKPDYFFPGLSE